MKELAKLNEEVTKLYKASRSQCIEDGVFRSELAKSFNLGAEDAYRNVLEVIHKIYFDKGVNNE